MNATWKKHERRIRRCNDARWAALDKVTCPRCGGKGAHFVPPSLGEAGFFSCEREVVATSAPNPLTARA
jgi:hypothetical protein